MTHQYYETIAGGSKGGVFDDRPLGWRFKGTSAVQNPHDQLRLDRPAGLNSLPLRLLGFCLRK
jgi:hypothetical protein